MLEIKTNTEAHIRDYYPVLRIIDDFIPFVFDISVLVRSSLKME